MRHLKLSLSSEIKNSERYARFLEDYAKINKYLNVSELVSEVLSLQVKRRIKRMSSSSLLANSQVELVDANAQNMAFRSRVTEIRTTLFIASSELEELIDRFWKWASTEFNAEFMEMKLRSIDSRWSYIGNIISKQQRRKAKIDSAIEVCRLFIEDYDAAGWSLKRIQETVQMNIRDK